MNLYRSFIYILHIIVIDYKLKSRELFEVMGSKGAEGDKNDDWLLIDCHTFLVHLMLPGTIISINHLIILQYCLLLF